MKIKSAGVFHSLRPFLAGTLVFACFFFCAALNLAAQELDQRSAESACIYYAEGMDFTVSLSGERAVFPAESAGNEGIYLERSAVLNTGAGSFVELQLIPSGTVIKLSENTSLAYNGFDETGKFMDFGLLYGRIRIVAGNGNDSSRTGGNGFLVIRSGTVSARIGEGDYGIDYVLEPGNQNSIVRPLFRIFVFRGNAEVFPYARGGNQANFNSADTLTAIEGETLSMDVSSSYTFVEKKPLGRDITGYWMLHNFAGVPPLPMPNTIMTAVSPEYPVTPEPVVSNEAPPGIAVLPPPVPESQPLIPVEPEKTSMKPSVIKAKNTLTLLGLGLTVMSMAVQGGAYYQYNESNNEVPRRIFSYAYIPLSFGVMCSLLGILYNPSGR